jgi:hypothetical protein
MQLMTTMLSLLGAMLAADGDDSLSVATVPVEVVVAALIVGGVGVGMGPMTPTTAALPVDIASACVSRSIHCQ